MRSAGFALAGARPADSPPPAGAAGSRTSAGLLQVVRVRLTPPASSAAPRVVPVNIAHPSPTLPAPRPMSRRPPRPHEYCHQGWSPPFRLLPRALRCAGLLPCSFPRSPETLLLGGVAAMAMALGMRPASSRSEPEAVAAERRLGEQVGTRIRAGPRSSSPSAQPSVSSLCLLVSLRVTRPHSRPTLSQHLAAVTFEHLGPASLPSAVRPSPTSWPRPCSSLLLRTRFHSLSPERPPHLHQVASHDKPRPALSPEDVPSRSHPAHLPEKSSLSTWRHTGLLAFTPVDSSWDDLPFSPLGPSLAEGRACVPLCVPTGVSRSFL